MSVGKSTPFLHTQKYQTKIILQNNLHNILKDLSYTNDLGCLGKKDTVVIILFLLSHIHNFDCSILVNDRDEGEITTLYETLCKHDTSSRVTKIANNTEMQEMWVRSQQKDLLDRK